MNNSRDLELLYEIGTLRFMDRVWIQFHRPNVANVAEHTLRVAWIAQMIAKREGGDMAKVTRMALVHDLGKSRAGDAHWLNRAYLKRDETKAVADAAKDTSLEGDLNELWAEFKAGQSLEAKIVKDADNLDVDLEFAERKDDWHFARTEDDIRRQVYETKLYTKTARSLWNEIQLSDPHKWYVDVYHRPEQLGEVGASQ